MNNSFKPPDRVLRLIASFMLSAVCAYSANMSDLISTADAIVVGSVTTRTESSESVSFSVNVVRVLKGVALSATLEVKHSWNRKVLGFQSGPTNIDRAFHGMWFLRQTNTANWDVLPVGGLDGLMPSLFLPAALVLPPSHQQSLKVPLTDKIVLELAAGLKAGGRSPEGLLSWTRQVRSPSMQAALTDFVASPIAEFRSAGLAGQLDTEQPDAITRIEEVWPSIRNDASRSHVIRAIRDSYRDTAPNSVRQLARLAAENADLRMAAITALAAVHTREALPFLAELLTSADPAERMKGVFGISAFANGCPPQTPDNLANMAYLQIPASSPYQTEETRKNFAFRRGGSEPEEEPFISFWITWWRAHPEFHLRAQPAANLRRISNPPFAAVRNRRSAFKHPPPSGAFAIPPSVAAAIGPSPVPAAGRRSPPPNRPRPSRLHPRSAA
jgi:hypothetical protein